MPDPEIERLLPHRAPFLFVDELAQASAERVVARRTFGEADFFLAGHFPGYPVVPGLILVEAMAQAGGAGACKLGVVGGDSLFFLASVEKARFRRQVRPGEELRMEVENLRVSARSLRQAGKAWVGDELAVEAEWLCLVGPAAPPVAEPAAAEGGRS